MFTQFWRRLARYHCLKWSIFQQLAFEGSPRQLCRFEDVLRGLSMSILGRWRQSRADHWPEEAINGIPTQTSSVPYRRTWPSSRMTLTRSRASGPNPGGTCIALIRWLEPDRIRPCPKVDRSQTRDPHVRLVIGRRLVSVLSRVNVDDGGRNARRARAHRGYGGRRQRLVQTRALTGGRRVARGPCRRRGRQGIRLSAHEQMIGGCCIPPIRQSDLDVTQLLVRAASLGPVASGTLKRTATNERRILFG